MKDSETIRRQLKYEFLDTLFSMGVGWAINSAMILVAAAIFFTRSAPLLYHDLCLRSCRLPVFCDIIWGKSCDTFG